MQCLLCGQNQNTLVKAHIFPEGFFNLLPSKRRVDTYKSGIRQRKLHNAIYDPNILCESCEQKILQPLDDYAIKVLRDKRNAKIINLPKPLKLSIWYFNSIDKRIIRAFIASMLWRSSVSQQIELRNFSIDPTYEEKIRLDLLHQGSFDYIDIFLTYLTHPLHSAFFVPSAKALIPIDKDRDNLQVNGYLLQFPNISITVTLGNFPHPNRVFYVLDTTLTGETMPLKVSTSLSHEGETYNFCVFQCSKYDELIKRIKETILESKN